MEKQLDFNSVDLPLHMIWLGQEHKALSWDGNNLTHYSIHSWFLVVTGRNSMSSFLLKRDERGGTPQEAKLELWSLPFGLISYSLTFNCSFFLSNFNHNVSYVLSLTTQNNWPFFALLSSLFSPLSPNRRGLQDNVRKGGQCSGCGVSISGSSSSGPMQNYKITWLNPWPLAPF